MARTRTAAKPRREITINLRATPQTRDIIDRAAALKGQTRSQFMLDSARQHAEDVVLDQRHFVLNERDFAKFMALLDNPPPAGPRLKKLLADKAPWEK